MTAPIYIQTHTITCDSSDSLVAKITSIGGGQVGLGEPVPASSTDLLINWAVIFANIKAIFIVSDVDMTVKTNSSSVPDDTLTLTAGIPLSWTSVDPADCLLTADVTKLYATNAGSDDGLLQIRCVYDATP